MMASTTKIVKYLLFTCLAFSYSLAFASERLDMEGLSIIGNKELPNVLYIVPWQSPDLPEMTEPPLTALINASLEPVSRESVIRNQIYYKLLGAPKPIFLLKSK